MMTLIRRLFLWFLILAFAALGAFGVYLQLHGERLAEEHLSRVFKRPVHVGRARVQLPFGLSLYDFEIEGVLKSRAVDIQLRLPLVFDKQLLVSRFTLVEPFIFVARDKEAKFTLPIPDGSAPSIQTPPQSEPAVGETPSAVFKNKKSSPIQGVFIDRLQIQKGKIQYVDESLEKDYKIRLEDLDLKAADVSYPVKSVKSRCRFAVVILGEDIAFSGSKVQGDGWVNLAEKDMNAKVEALQPNAEQWLTVNLVSEKNDMTVEGKVDINQITKTNHDTKDISLQDYVFGALQSSGLQVGLGFKFQTKMDAFKVDKVSLFGDVRYQEGGTGESSPFEENLKKIGEQLGTLGSGTPENINAVAPAVPAEGSQAAPEGTLAQ